MKKVILISTIICNFLVINQNNYATEKYNSDLLMYTPKEFSNSVTLSHSSENDKTGENIRPKKTIRINYFHQNKGNDLAENYTVKLYLKDKKNTEWKEIDKEDVSSLKAENHKESLSYIWDGLETGEYTLKIILDSTNKVKEINENNNEIQMNFVVKEDRVGRADYSAFPL